MGKTVERAIDKGNVKDSGKERRKGNAQEGSQSSRKEGGKMRGRKVGRTEEEYKISINFKFSPRPHFYLIFYV